MKKRFLIALLLTAIMAIVLSGAVPTQAAPQRASASFGLLMKPGWGGGDSDPSRNYTAILVLRCALLNKYRSREPGTTKIVITGTMIAYQLGATCANFPGKGMGTGIPIGEVFQPYTGTTDVFPAR
jgi:hypothetical protein